jgi:hypothetical protein
MRARTAASAAAHCAAQVAAAHHLHARRQVGRRLDVHRQAEAVEQLRAQLALLGVAASHQHEARRVPHRQALALDHVLARGCDVDQQVDQVVLEQVDLVDVQEAAVRPRQQPGLEVLLAVGERALEVEGAEHAVLGHAQWQVDHRHRHDAGGKPGLAPAGFGHAAARAESGRRRRRAVVGAAVDHLHARQQRGQRPHRGALAGAAVAEHEHAADARVDGGDQQRTAHLVLADDRGEGVGVAHRGGRQRRTWDQDSPCRRRRLRRITHSTTAPSTGTARPATRSGSSGTPPLRRPFAA